MDLSNPTKGRAAILPSSVPSFITQARQRQANEKTMGPLAHEVHPQQQDKGLRPL